jgi:hypothetical protein
MLSKPFTFSVIGRDNHTNEQVNDEEGPKDDKEHKKESDEVVLFKSGDKVWSTGVHSSIHHG